MEHTHRDNLSLSLSLTHTHTQHTPILAHAVANADACAEADGERAERVQRDRVHEERALDEVGGGGRVVADAHDVRELEQRVRVVEAVALVQVLRDAMRTSPIYKYRLCIQLDSYGYVY